MIYLDRLGTGNITPILAELMGSGEYRFMGSPGSTYTLAAPLTLLPGVEVDLGGGTLVATHASASSSVTLTAGCRLFNGSYVGMDPVGVAPPANNVLTGQYGIRLDGRGAVVSGMSVSGRVTPIVVFGDSTEVGNIVGTGLATVATEWNSHAMIVANGTDGAYIHDIDGTDFGCIVNVGGTSERPTVSRVVGRQTVAFNRDNLVYASSANRATISGITSLAQFDTAVKLRGDWGHISNVYAGSLTNLAVHWASASTAKANGFGAEGTVISSVKADGCPQGAVFVRADSVSQIPQRGLVVEGVWATGGRNSATEGAVYGWAIHAHISDVTVINFLGHALRLAGEVDHTATARGGHVTVEDMTIEDQGTTQSTIQLISLDRVSVGNVSASGTGHATFLDLQAVTNGTFRNLRSAAGAVAENAACAGNSFVDVLTVGAPSLLGTTHRDYGVTAGRPANPVPSQRYFNTTTGAPEWWNGTAWVTWPAAGATPVNVTVTGTGAATTFTVTHNLALTTPFIPSSIMVLDPGGNLLSSSAYDLDTPTANNFTARFSVAPANGAVHIFRVTA